MRLSRDSLDTDVMANYGIDDLDMNSIEQYKSELIKSEEYSSYEGLDISTFLKRIGVMSKDYENSGNYGITAGGLLFFGDNNAILHRFPTFQLDYFDKSHPDQERWSSRISSIEKNLNIYSFFKLTDEHLKATIPNSFKLDENGKRVDTFGSMYTAIREGLINMLMHADYFEDSPITFNEYTNYYEFLNPGKMKIPSEDFFTTNNSKNRNAIISKLFLQVGFGERAGHGGEKIFESAVQNDFRDPIIETNIYQTKLIIWKVDYANSFSGKKIADREREVLRAIISSGIVELSHGKIEEITGYSRYVADKAIYSLVDKEIIEKRGVGRATRFALPTTNEQLIAQIQAMPDMLRNIINNSK
ncbi:transcriptional regulator [Companilactobacillus nantensis DSM 16982]|uniref:Transcriptional regulator n=2 Tax=Companilactobacillus nantensis TaxID=305793 RepID=A0A0R1WKR8_9LACO|nr:transcriptional regulator [Companilactobacillus nantensis DSM 16982]